MTDRYLIDVTAALRNNSLRLDNREIHEFLIGNEDDPWRYQVDGLRLAMILIGNKIIQSSPRRKKFDRFLTRSTRSPVTVAVKNL